MKITKTVLLLSVIAVFFLYGCGKKEEPVTSIETHVDEKEEKNDQVEKSRNAFNDGYKTDRIKGIALN